MMKHFTGQAKIGKHEKGQGSCLQTGNKIHHFGAWIKGAGWGGDSSFGCYIMSIAI